MSRERLVGERQRACNLGKTRKMALLSIKKQRPPGMVRFRNEKKFSSHASGNTKPGWNRPFSPSFGRGRSKAPSLSMADERQDSWREQKVEVCLLLSSGGLSHVMFVNHDLMCSTFVCFQTLYWSNLYCKRTFPRCTFPASPTPRDILRAPTETLTVSVAFACQGKLIL